MSILSKIKARGSKILVPPISADIRASYLRAVFIFLLEYLIDLGNIGVNSDPKLIILKRDRGGKLYKNKIQARRAVPNFLFLFIESLLSNRKIYSPHTSKSSIPLFSEVNFGKKLIIAANYPLNF